MTNTRTNKYSFRNRLIAGVLSVIAVFSVISVSVIGAGAAAVPEDPETTASVLLCADFDKVKTDCENGLLTEGKDGPVLDLDTIYGGNAPYISDKAIRIFPANDTEDKDEAMIASLFDVNKVIRNKKNLITEDKDGIPVLSLEAVFGSELPCMID